MDEVFLRRLSRWQADQQREAAADLYVESYAWPAGTDAQHRESFLARFAEHVQRPRFDMMVAGGSSLAGCAYGFPIERDGGWWKGFVGVLPVHIEELTAAGKVFALAELMVLPDHRRHGLATRLQEQLLVRPDATLVTAFVDPSRTAAVAAYQTWGWSVVGQAKPSAEGPVLDVLVRPLHR